MDLSVRADGPYASGKYTWLGSKHGVSDGRTITLVVSTFASGFLTAQYIPSGVAIGKITSAGATQNMYGFYDNAATDGRQTMVGHLLTAKSVKGVGLYIGAALFEHGKVILANLPSGHGVDSAGQTDVAGRIIYL